MTDVHAARLQTKPFVVFGLLDGKPRAGLFPGKEAKLVRKAAKELELSVMQVTTPAQAELVARVPPGRLYANRKSFVPYVRRDVHDRLAAAAKGAKDDPGNGGKSDQGPPNNGIPKDWDSIGPGHQVIAQSSVPDGWWEAIVLDRDGEMLSLKWRDYPKEPKFKRHLQMIAIQMVMPPQAKSAS